MKNVEIFYENNIDLCEEMWQDHIANNDWGSGEDEIKITDDMFWEFIEDKIMGKDCEDISWESIFETLNRIELSDIIEKGTYENKESIIENWNDCSDDCHFYRVGDKLGEKLFELAPKGCCGQNYFEAIYKGNNYKCYFSSGH